VQFDSSGHLLSYDYVRPITMLETFVAMVCEDKIPLVVCVCGGGSVRWWRCCWSWWCVVATVCVHHPCL
jgi:hypothetical protein